MRNCIIGVLAACVVVGCASECEITREYLLVMKWNGERREYHETEYAVSSVRFGAHRFYLLGFDPWVQSLPAGDPIAGGPSSCAVLGCRSQQHTCLYLVQHEKQLYLLGVADKGNPGSAGCLKPLDLARLMARQPGLFTRINDASKYAGPRFYAETERSRLPIDLNPIPIHDREALAIDPRP